MIYLSIRSCSINKSGESREDRRFKPSDEKANDFLDSNNKNDQIEKDKEIIENWRKLRKQSHSIQENFNLRNINNYINPQIPQNPSGRNNKNESTTNLKNLQQKNDSANMNFTLSFIIRYCICNPKSTREKKKLKVFSNLNNYLTQRMDLIYYLRTLFAIEMTNSFIFNPFQKKLLEYPFKPNIFNGEDLHAFGLDKQDEAKYPKSEITDYYNSRIKENTIDKYDITILKHLPQALTGDIDFNKPPMMFGEN